VVLHLSVHIVSCTVDQGALLGMLAWMIPYCRDVSMPGRSEAAVCIRLYPAMLRFSQRSLSMSCRARVGIHLLARLLRRS